MAHELLKAKKAFRRERRLAKKCTTDLFRWYHKEMEAALVRLHDNALLLGEYDVLERQLQEAGL